MTRLSMKASLFLLVAVLAPAALFADTRSSADYTILQDTLDSAGQRGTSASYAADQSVSAIGSIATAAGGLTLRQGYTGLLLDVAGLSADIEPQPLAELAEGQLSAVLANDDGSFVPIPAQQVAWSVITGPIRNLTPEGLVTADRTYTTSAATIKATWQGYNNNVDFSITESVPDNFGIYTGDGVNDAWQVQWFGENNPLGVGGSDADGDGDPNALEWAAGVNPTNANDRFEFTLQSITASVATLRFNKVIPGTQYKIMKNASDLGAGAWVLLQNLSFPALGTNVDTQDASIPGKRYFYRVDLIRSP